MAKKLVIVESPAKAHTIKKFLGRGFQVEASMGNVRDLPRSQFGVDVKNDFAPKYITIRGRGPVLQKLRKAASSADRVYLATDPDREGEAIAWHLSHALKLDEDHNRVTFYEITKPAVQQAFKNPRGIDVHLVNAQQARRILDRIVGYKLSPLLWEKVKKGLSAGRVQSPALRLIVEREEEIESFEPEEYWTVTALLATQKGDSLEAGLYRLDGRKPELPDEETTMAVVAPLREARYVVQDIQRKERKRYPAPPFITSTLQQEASRRLRFSPSRTMRIAQQLYEGLDLGDEGSVGLITYMRTDSHRIAEQAQAEAREVVTDRYGQEYLPSRAPTYKNRAGAQEAHEAIRPTSVWRTPESVSRYLTRDQFRLYRLIWERFVASQMAPAILDTTTVDIKADNAIFRATGQILKFAGFMAVYVEQKDDGGEDEDGSGSDQDRLLPPLEKGQVLRLEKLDPQQHFTKPPPRYTEAMLVRALEELGIGRPSTYAAILEKIRDRAYVTIEQGRLKPTDLGRKVVQLMKEFFPDIIDIEFTANMEEKLDEVEAGKRDWVDLLREFYGPFVGELEKAYEEMDQVEIEDEVTDEVCEKCGRNMIIKHGRYGEFLACPGFPECRNTRPLVKEVGVKCPKCGQKIVERRSRKGRVFYGCSGYPDCDFVSWYRPVDKKCPSCGQLMVLRRRRNGEEYLACFDRECGERSAVEAL